MDELSEILEVYLIAKYIILKKNFNISTIYYYAIK